MGTEINHSRVIITGSNEDITGELWEFGVSLYARLASSLADVETVQNDFDAATDSFSDSGTGWTGSANYLMEGGVSDINPLDYLVNQVIPSLTTFFAVDLYRINQRIDEITIYPFDNDGKVCALPVGPAKATIQYTASWIKGTGNGYNMAPFQSNDVGLATAANIPRGRGRFFPPPSQANDTDPDTGILTNTAAQALADRGSALMDGMRLTDGGGNYCMWPCVIGDPWTTAYTVKGTRVNAVPGTQRRRKNQIPPAYYSATI